MTLTTYPALVLERGLADQRLWDWHQQVVEGNVKRRVITITLRNERGGDVWGWTVHSAFPVKWSVSDFDAASGQVATESIELVHHGILRRVGRERRGMRPALPLGVIRPLAPMIGARGTTRAGRAAGADDLAAPCGGADPCRPRRRP